MLFNILTDTLNCGSLFFGDFSGNKIKINRILKKKEKKNIFFQVHDEFDFPSVGTQRFSRTTMCKLHNSGVI